MARGLAPLLLVAIGEMASRGRFSNLIKKAVNPRCVCENKTVPSAGSNFMRTKPPPPKRRPDFFDGPAPAPVIIEKAASLLGRGGYVKGEGARPQS